MQTFQSVAERQHYYAPAELEVDNGICGRCGMADSHECRELGCHVTITDNECEDNDGRCNYHASVLRGEPLTV